MSQRSHFSGKNLGKREQDHRNDHRPPHVRRNAPYEKGKKFFSKTFICKRQQFIRLFCPRCHTGCLKFKDYRKHLHSEKHHKAIAKHIQAIERTVDLKRKEQQAAQLAADEAAQAQGTSSIVKYCEVCNLTFHQEDSKHIASEFHVVLQELLKPVCNICSYGAKNILDYENHICSLDHVMREEGWTGELESSQQNQQIDKELSQKTPQQPLSLGEASGNSTKTAALENSASMTAFGNQTNTEESGNMANPEGNDNPPRDPNEPCGNDKSVISKVTALYCSCCNVYFGCEGGHEAATVKHCATEEHLVMWYKYVEDKHKADNATKVASATDPKD